MRFDRRFGSDNWRLRRRDRRRRLLLLRRGLIADVLFNPRHSFTLDGRRLATRRQRFLQLFCAYDQSNAIHVLNGVDERRAIRQLVRQNDVASGDLQFRQVGARGFHRLANLLFQIVFNARRHKSIARQPDHDRGNEAKSPALVLAKRPSRQAGSYETANEVRPRNPKVRFRRKIPRAPRRRQPSQPRQRRRRREPPTSAKRPSTAFLQADARRIAVKTPTTKIDSRKIQSCDAT